jgi:hypothetical protein
LAIAIGATIDTIDRFIDRSQLATLRFNQLTIQLVLDRVGRSIEHVTRSFLMQLAKQAEITFQGAMEGIAPSDELFTQFFD